jgi:hypothetical protein
MKVMTKLAQTQAGLKTLRWSIVIFVAGMLIRTVLLFLTGYDGPVERSEPINTGRVLARSGALSDPYETLQTGPTAHVAPLSPLLVSRVARIFGPETRGFETAIHFLSIFVTTLQYALLPWLARAFFSDPRADVIAGLPAALIPLRLSLESMGNFETMYTGLLMAVLFLAAVRWLLPNPAGIGFAFGYGAAWGLTALVSRQCYQSSQVFVPCG